ncbi:MAG: response regulator [Candidatus Hydrogenedentota bacterium]
MSGERVMIVDDEDDLLYCLSMVLEGRGYHVLGCGSGTEAIERAIVEKPAIIFADVLMPRMDGWELCRRLKEDARCRNIPVIMITASPLKEYHDKALAAGAEALVMKPFDLDHVAEMIERYARREVTSLLS